MKIAYIVFEGITWLDLIGVHDAVSRLKQYDYLPSLSWDFCSFDGKAKDGHGLEMVPTVTGGSLNAYDVVMVPGGHGTRKLQHEKHFITWLQTAIDAEYKVSVCTGSLLLGAAGFLKNKISTTNFQEYEALAKYCSRVSTERIVADGKTITAGAVSASIDLGLYLCKVWAGEDAAEYIRKKMDYHTYSSPLAEG